MTNGIENLPTTTAHQSRLRIFQATRRPMKLAQKIETSWGWIIIDGRLGQAHADILEVIMHKHLNARKLDDGRLQILIDPYVLRRAVGGYGHDKLWDRMKDLKATTMEVFVMRSREKYLCSILDEVQETESRIMRDPRSSAMRQADVDDDGTGRRKWRFTFSRQWSQFIENDVGRYYDPENVIKLRHGVSQAIARLIKTHQSQPNGGWDRDGLILAVCGKVDSITMRHRRREIKLDADGLKACGLISEGSKIRLEE